MAFLKIEQETLISFNERESSAELYTASPVMIRKMDKLVEENPEEFKLGRVEYFQGKVYSKRYHFPKGYVSIRTKKPQSNWTEERREAQRQRMKEIRAAQLAE